MIKEVDYQINAVRELVEKTQRLLDADGNRLRLVFKAPTGSGKTVMASKMLDELYTLSAEQGQDIAYIWIAPNKLHEQSYMRMKKYFSETHALQPVMYDELDHTVSGYIKPGEVLFVNWESINKESNLMVKDTENSASLYDIVRRTKEEHGMKLIVIIDEEHRFTGAAAKQSAAVLHRLNAKVEIGISATPNTSNADEMVTVRRNEVIKAEMIKDGITINPKLTDSGSELSENEYLLDRAMAKREEIKAAYAQVGAKINPLLLIQLPNDNIERLDAEEKSIADMVKLRLETKYDITTDNKRLAVWLSGEKENLEGIELDYDTVDALLFKEAIALGWDCPRAAVLLIFRDIKSTTFGTQTVGRIMRMPEQKYYTEGLLNHGWVYTNLESSKIVIEQTDMGYLTMPLVARRRENLVNVALPSIYMERLSADRNRLGPDFYPVLVETFNRLWLNKAIEQDLFETDPFATGNSNDSALVNYAGNRRKAEQTGGIDFSLHDITSQMVSNVDITGEAETVDVGEKQKRHYAKTQYERGQMLTDFCAEMLAGFEKLSITTLRGYLCQAMEFLFEVFETDVPRVVLYHNNKPKFKDLITRAIERYRQKMRKRQEEAKKRSKKEYKWEVPEVRDYNAENNSAAPEVADHALLPFVRRDDASNPEKEFEQFLEQNKDSIDWWYKNGENGKQHYAIPYDAGEDATALFYPDFIIRMKNGQVFIFDTKTADSDIFAPQKHNALLKYMESDKNKAQHLLGGIIIREGDLWRYSQLPIESTTDLNGWTAFHPNQYK